MLFEAVVPHLVRVLHEDLHVRPQLPQQFERLGVAERVVLDVLGEAELPELDLVVDDRVVDLDLPVAVGVHLLHLVLGQARLELRVARFRRAAVPRARVARLAVGEERPAHCRVRGRRG